MNAGWGQQWGGRGCIAAPNRAVLREGGTEAAPRNPHQRAGRSLLGQRPSIQARPGAST